MPGRAGGGAVGGESGGEPYLGRLAVHHPHLARRSGTTAPLRTKQQSVGSLVCRWRPGERIGPGPGPAELTDRRRVVLIFLQPPWDHLAWDEDSSPLVKLRRLVPRTNGCWSSPGRRGQTTDFWVGQAGGIDRYSREGRAVPHAKIHMVRRAVPPSLRTFPCSARPLAAGSARWRGYEPYGWSRGGCTGVMSVVR